MISSRALIVVGLTLLAGCASPPEALLPPVRFERSTCGRSRRGNVCNLARRSVARVLSRDSDGSKTSRLRPLTSCCGRGRIERSAAHSAERIRFSQPTAGHLDSSRAAACGGCRLTAGPTLSKSPTRLSSRPGRRGPKMVASSLRHSGSHGLMEVSAAWREHQDR